MAGKAGGRGRGVTRLRGNAPERVRTAKGRRVSSTRWLARQLNDPYVAAARRQGLRSRAAFKLIELDTRFKFLKRGARVVDLGAAPGGWSQVAAERVGVAAEDDTKEAGAQAGTGVVVAVDLIEMEPVPGARHLTLDFLAEDSPARIRALLDGPADVVLSDMAAPSTGHAPTDHLRIMALLEVAYDFARAVLAPGGTFVGKVLRGGTERELLRTMKRDFAEVKHVKPPASRKDSAEIYVVALGFRGTDRESGT